MAVRSTPSGRSRALALPLRSEQGAEMNKKRNAIVAAIALIALLLVNPKFLGRSAVLTSLLAGTAFGQMLGIEEPHSATVYSLEDIPPSPPNSPYGCDSPDCGFGDSPSYQRESDVRCDSPDCLTDRSIDSQRTQAMTCDTPDCLLDRAFSRYPELEARCDSPDCRQDYKTLSEQYCSEIECEQNPPLACESPDC